MYPSRLLTVIVALIGFSVGVGGVVVVLSCWIFGGD